jgi:hypothetical protein
MSNIPEGWKPKFTVLKNEDIEKHLTSPMKHSLVMMCDEIESGRKLEGKSKCNSYVVINLNEPYAEEVIEIMKRHGHWG